MKIEFDPGSWIIGRTNIVPYHFKGIIIELNYV